MKFKKGDILLFKNGTSFYSKMIQWATSSKYSHVGLLLDPDPKKLTTGEALSKGFHIQDSYGWIDKLIEEDKVDVFRYQRLGANQAQSIVDFAYSIEGTKYDWMDIFDIGVLVLTGARIKTGSANKYICSEAVAKAYGRLDIQLCPKFDDEVTPADISRSKLLKRMK